MSAWIVSRTHIDLMVSEMVAHKIITPDQATDTGRLLWRENLISVAYRYPRDTDGNRPGPIDFRDSDVDTYTFTPVELSLLPCEIVTLVHCFDYQSCEHPGWRNCKAKRLCDALITATGATESGMEQRLRQVCTGVCASRYGAPRQHGPWGWDQEDVTRIIGERHTAARS